jgi:stage V sporulation protein B
LGISFFSNEILSILFVNETENIAVVSPLLSVLGISVLFSCLITTTNAILHSYKKIFLPIAAMISGAVVKLISEYFLIGNSFIGAFGAPLSTLLCDMTIAFINLVNIVKCVPKINDTIVSLWRIFLAALLSVGASKALYGLFYNVINSVLLSFIASAFVAVVLYFVLAFSTKAVSIDDLRLLPKADKILTFIENKKSRKKL